MYAPENVNFGGCCRGAVGGSTRGLEGWGRFRKQTREKEKSRGTANTIRGRDFPNLSSSIKNSTRGEGMFFRSRGGCCGPCGAGCSSAAKEVSKWVGGSRSVTSSPTESESQCRAQAAGAARCQCRRLLCGGTSARMGILGAMEGGQREGDGWCFASSLKLWSLLPH